MQVRLRAEVRPKRDYGKESLMKHRILKDGGELTSHAGFILAETMDCLKELSVQNNLN